MPNIIITQYGLNPETKQLSQREVLSPLWPKKARLVQLKEQDIANHFL
jgi:hypothetical protein